MMNRWPARLATALLVAVLLAARSTSNAGRG